MKKNPCLIWVQYISRFGFRLPDSIIISTDAVIYRYVFRSLKKATRQKGKTIRENKK